MKRAKQVVLFTTLVAVAAAAFLGARGVRAGRPTEGASRKFAITYEVHVPADASGQSRLWIPIPQSDEHQIVRNLTIESAVAHQPGKEREYGNAFESFSPTAAQAAAGYDVTLKFEVTRREFARDVGNVHLAAVKAGAPGNEPMLARYLQPDKMVPLNARIAELANEQTAGASAPIEKARRIYDYVVSTMKYDKSGDGWGRGDEMWACDSKRGNCTDFHSVLIGMLRSSGIPARFEIGMPLPEGKTEGDIAGYHCWAEFYVDGIGWIPVDASEAAKNPGKRNYFFGAVDADRVRFTYGRDLRLSPEQQGEPLNFFVYPYAESNGQPVKNLKTHFAFKDIDPRANTAASR